MSTAKVVPIFSATAGAPPFQVKVSKKEQRRRLIASLVTGLESGRRTKYVPSQIPLASINVLPQPRKTFEEIRELADSIADQELGHPLIVAELDLEHCVEYLEVVGRLHNKRLDVGGLKPTRFEDGREVFYLLIDGERRFRALKHLLETGCTPCREAVGKKKLLRGMCFHKHFPDGLVSVSILRNVSVLQALNTQFSANTHHRVLPWEEAKAFRDYYQGVFLVADPEFPLATFARRVGYNVGTVRKALNYCSLPEFIQEYVERGQLQYGHALELYRLRQLVDSSIMDDAMWQLWVSTALQENESVADFRKRVNDEITQRRNGQTTIFDFMSVGDTIALTSKTPVFAMAASRHIRASIGWFNMLAHFLEEGKIGLPDSPFSERAALQNYSDMVKAAAGIIPLLRAHAKDLRISKRKIDQAEVELDQMDRAVADLEKVMGT